MQALPASVPNAPPAPSHLLRLGGREAVVRLVNAFYAAMDTRPEAAVIRAMHEADLTTTRAVLVDYLTEWMGGEKRYSALHGAPMLRRRHQRFEVDDAASDAWMNCMRQALAETCADHALMAELDAAFDKVARAIRNKPAPDPAGPPSMAGTTHLPVLPSSFHPHRKPLP
ncbi:group II truncated hemoglobin [Ideonella azotifigens]|uniref:Globin n=1 Tax=Ideonella azotifigens TaxID=513160 RepID=A0ABP3V5J5_9BURK|nr:group II truncated hemoglobin [Ideonella azotifigens]MCD2343269.1 group II truncated hemoglobin [Ideonella azotifigens]